MIVFFLETITNLFPLLVMGSTVLGYARPSLFVPYMSYIPKALAMTMVMMGLTLTTRDIAR
jgi:predicted Na+-dependent transporter